MSVWMQNENPYLPVIGVVGNVSEGAVRNDSKPTIFYDHRQLTDTAMTLFVRTTQPAALAGPAVAAIHELDRTSRSPESALWKARWPKAWRVSGSSPSSPAASR